MSHKNQTFDMDIPWKAGKTYRFRCIDSPRPSEEARFKEVYYGFFVGEAPENLEPNVSYYLKKILVHPDDFVMYNQSNQAVFVNKYPQSREKYELLDLNGQHLRKVLACNQNVLDIRHKIMSNQELPILEDCYIVERPYKMLPNPEVKGDPLDHTPAEEWELLEELTVYERLTYMEQVCRSLKELYTHRVYTEKVVAHWDLKLSNCLIV